jgi:lipopolysaccharide biosynthesis protein
MLVKNEGYDFGKWYQALGQIDVTSYDTVAFVNDSCVLFRSLDPFWKWLNAEHAQVAGMTRSHFRGEHIQSYFMVLRGKAIAVAQNHFNETRLVNGYDEVISKYEIALNARFRAEGLTLASFVDNGGYQGEFSPYYKCVEYHIKQGIPLIKKRILTADYRKAELFTLARMNFKISPSYYLALIKRGGGQLLFDPAELVKNSRMNPLQRLRYELTRQIINIGRPIKRLALFGK